MKRYQPTTQEIDALFLIAYHLTDAVNINNEHFYDPTVDDDERKLIFEATKKIYKSCLTIYEANKSLPFG
jgi:hypothetical protein